MCTLPSQHTRYTEMKKHPGAHSYDEPSTNAIASSFNKSVTSRRRLIQALATGGLVSSSGMVPKKWMRPLVQGVLLPAHASTSNPNLTSCPDVSENCVLILPGKSLRCDQADEIGDFDEDYHVIDDTNVINDCPGPAIIRQVSKESFGRLEMICRAFLKRNQNPLAVNVSLRGNQSALAGCNGQERTVELQDITHTSLGGNTWYASYSISVDENGLHISDMTFTCTPTGKS